MTDLETAQARLLEKAHAEGITAEYLSPLHWVVRSTSVPGDRHCVTFDQGSGYWVACSGVGGEIECPGMAHFGYCRHVLIAKEARDLYLSRMETIRTCDEQLSDMLQDSLDNLRDSAAKVLPFTSPDMEARMRRMFGA